MKRLLIILALVLVALVAYVTIWPNREDPTDGTTFYYYPRANVYFDVERGRYIHQDSSTGSWQKSKKLPGNRKEKLGQYVILNHPTPPVCSQNSQHRLVYGATLYARDADIRRKFVEDSLRSVVVPKPAPGKMPFPSKTDSSDTRTGIERFLDRLFGKEETRKNN
jgi:hypothetical protein